jgi:uncharacterized protein YbjT (DUF2867 family)
VAEQLEREGVELREADVLDPESLRGAGEGVDVAYYLVHSMGRGSNGNFVERERTAARNFARMASEEGIRQGCTSAASAAQRRPRATSAAATRRRKSSARRDRR